MLLPGWNLSKVAVDAICYIIHIINEEVEWDCTILTPRYTASGDLMSWPFVCIICPSMHLFHVEAFCVMRTSYPHVVSVFAVVLKHAGAGVLPL